MKTANFAWFVLLSIAIQPGCPRIRAQEADARLSQPADRPCVIYVITHGLRTPPAYGPAPWAKRMAAELTRQGGTCLVVDWAAESNNAAEGWAYSAADETLARLFELLLRAEGPVELHFIGHSRGTVVNSLVHQRLREIGGPAADVVSKIQRVDVTMLDPHAANGHGRATGGSKKLKRLSDDLNRLANDPEPIVHEGTDYAEVFMQRGVPGRGEADLNPWGYGPGTACLEWAHLLLDVTHYSCNGAPVTHQTIPDWYLESVVIPCGKRGEAPFFGVRRPRKEAEGAVRVARDGEPASPVFNGDFCYDGQVRHWIWQSAAEPNCIPGWKGSHPLKVTADGKLRLCRGQSLAHNAMVVPAAATALSLELELVAAKKGDDRTGDVRISFVPIPRREAGADVEAEGAKPQLLAAIPLAEIHGGNCHIPLPEHLAGTAGMLQIAVIGEGTGNAWSVVLDNVSFEAATAEPSQVEPDPRPNVISAADASPRD